MIAQFLSTIRDITFESGFVTVTGGQLIMLAVSCVLLYLAIKKQ